MAKTGRKIGKKKLSVIAAVGTVLLGAGSVYANVGNPFGTNTVGRQDDGSVLTDVNQFVTPAGQQLEFGGNPISVKVRPDGKTAAALIGRSNYGGNGINVVDLATGKLLTANFPLKLSTMWGLAYSPDGSHLYATGSSGSTGKVVIMSLAADGTPTIEKTVDLPQAAVGGNINPQDIMVGPDGKTLLVALNRDNTLGVLDLQTYQLTARIPVGSAPTSVVVSGNFAYVTNVGGRTAEPGDFTVDSSGTPIVAEPTGSSANGTVSVVDLATNTVVKNVEVGLQPARMTVADNQVFVANTNSDTVSVIDAKTNDVVQTIDVEPYPDAPNGSAPNAVTMIGDHQLAVSLGRNNAIAVYDWKKHSSNPQLSGLMPTAWFPVDLAVDPANGRLLVANADGVGSLGQERTLTIQGISVSGHSSYAQQGSLSLIPFPTKKDLVKGTDEVYANNDWFDISGRNAKPRNNKKPVAIPERIGEPSTIKHIFYIIKENRTYDQVFGDMGKGNSEPALTQFGENVTPNLHALANSYQLLDNFYTSGIQSASGHQWVMQGTNTDYEDKETDTANVRSYPGGAGDSLAYASTGHLWDNALKHNVSVVNFGEDTTAYTGTKPFGTWTDWYNDYLILSGQKQGELHVPIGDYQAKTDIPSLDPITYKPFPTFDNGIPDQYRYEIFKQQFEEYVKNDNLPQFMPMWVMADHTSGTATGAPTPQAAVADNDLAVGKIVDLISHSKYWKDSLILVTEDDSQNGLDHVDGHREPALVISPWAKKGIVDSHYWTVINMVRTIEQILGLPPMNQNDAAALPLSELFTDKPDFKPYNVVPNRIALDTLNGQPGSNLPAPVMTGSAASGTEAKESESAAADQTQAAKEIEKQWTAWSNANQAYFTGKSAAPDKVNANMLNHVTWYATKGFDQPYPGDSKVLTPAEAAEQPQSSAPSPAIN
ncbi:40-residue YVTN family beta-propeller repeat-containing protein [Paenibacillus sp. UNC496MF]|uniref:bifunctional YncE family protein/alkaline phosphatase family protein n=1 Tax=Paenibacillus sp. UNC496MF TaxID=1502753 RepID=UPI0008E85926|nr:bifunctional YncE family protein/alkaline phosphatase family protein [Paenibacillus sp. UNC496MF]SFJ12274.1 40-residue YVTN family beta-propeller repeat-containing protein [Paenibacillus sp. UNC496MF]